MGTIAEFENFLARCEVIRREHEETRAELESLPESEQKRELMAKFADSQRIAHDSERLAREALNRERAKLN